jgi:hypothetical protein
MDSFKKFFDKQFEERSADPKNWASPLPGWPKARIHTDAEKNRGMRQTIVESVIAAIKYYKNPTPKYIISKVHGWSGGDYSGCSGVAEIITELIRARRVFINQDGMLVVDEGNV